jgi:site-specific DNA recombinase
MPTEAIVKAVRADCDSRGALYVLLSNPIYIGEIAHKGARYPGQQKAILERETWENVQQQLRGATPERRGQATGMRSPLVGKIFDEAGYRLTPSTAKKGARRYRYYISRPLVTDTAEHTPDAWRVPALQLEELVAVEAAAMLAESSATAAALEGAGLLPETVPAALARAKQFRDDLRRDMTRGDVLAALVSRIKLSPIRLRVIISAATLLPPSSPEALTLHDAILTRDVPLHIKRRGVEMRLVIAGPSAAPTNRDTVL